MSLLIIISSHNLDVKWSNNIKILNDYVKSSNMNVEYCGISNQNDFHHYEKIIKFKYKIINTKQQLSKVCDFISSVKPNYTWYMKCRPDIQLLENINFNSLSEHAINARARVYHGPSKIKYGMSVNGPNDGWKNIGCCHYSEKEHDVVLDDMIYIFHKNVIRAFDKIDVASNINQNEWVHTSVFNNRGIPLHVIGINVCLTKYGTYSGNI